MLWLQGWVLRSASSLQHKSPIPQISHNHRDFQSPTFKQMVVYQEMQTPAHPSTSRHQCLRQIRHSLSTGNLTMNREMEDILGITIHSSGGEEHPIRPLSVSPTSSDHTSSMFIESLSIATGFSDSMLAFPDSGISKLSEWPYV